MGHTNSNPLSARGKQAFYRRTTLPGLTDSESFITPDWHDELLIKEREGGGEIQMD